MSASSCATLVLTTEEEYNKLIETLDDKEAPVIGKCISSVIAYYAYPDEDSYGFEKVTLSNQDIEDLKSGAKFLALTTTAHYNY